MPLTPRDAHGSHRGAPSPSAGVITPGAPSTTDAMLQSILRKLDESDKKFTARFDESDRRITAFIEHQESVNADFARKLDQIPVLVKTASDHGERIAVLEAAGAQLCGSQQSGHSSSAASRVSRTSDIIISGIPGYFTDTSSELVKSVFLALDISRLLADVLETRDVAVGASAALGGGLASISVPDSQACGSKKSIIVVLKSREVRDYILRVMRRRHGLTIEEVFSRNIPGKIYLNELLPTDAYNLLRRTRVRARQLAFKYVWCRDGKILVRKDQGHPPISIASDADLAELH